MSGTPRWKVYDGDGLYVAACRYIEDAAAVVGGHDDGSTIRDGAHNRRIVWREGKDGHAADSYDDVAATVNMRVAVR